MIQVYKTKTGIRVREGSMSVDINQDTLGCNLKLYPQSYVEKVTNELVYTYYGELEVGKSYPLSAIDPTPGMVVMASNNEVFQYVQYADKCLWLVTGSAMAKSKLPDGTYKILYKGE